MVVRPLFRAILLIVLCVAPVFGAGANVLSEPDRQAYRAAFQAVRNNDWSGAQNRANQAKDPILAKAVRFLDLTRANSGNRFADITAFIIQNPDWPSQALLRQRAEEAIATVGDEELTLWFERFPPLTPFARLREADIRLAHGDTARATEEIRQVWISAEFGPFDEKGVLQKYGKYIRREDEVKRLDRLLWEGHFEAAKRMLTRVDAGHRTLAEARMALATMTGNADRLVARVPRELASDPGFLFERMRWRRRKDMYDGAIDILDHAPKDLVRPQAWWGEREMLVRHALQNGDISLAYRLAARHNLTTGVGFADGEFLAGWVALRFLRDYQTGYNHFVRLYNEVTRPVSLARGAYWAGRAAEIQGYKDLASTWYQTAAKHLATYYGQLAAAKIGGDGKAAVLEDPLPSQAEIAAFDKQELVRVTRALAEAEAADFAKPFILKLSDLAKTPGDHALVATLAEQISRPDLAVAAAKRASYQGVVLLAQGYPITEVPDGGAVERPLVLAMTRQESGFDQGAVSPAGALGMMQLMPATAKTMAKSLEMPFSQQRLLTDRRYNVTLGRAYLGGLIDRYNGSYVLAIAAYNAGPARVSQWLHDLGDPRAKETDVIDWVESIPFGETRTYVQRVLENLQVYRLRIGDRGLAFSLPTDLKR